MSARDIGHGVSIKPLYEWSDGNKTKHAVGLVIVHKRPDGGSCAAAAHYEGTEHASPDHSWRIEKGTPEEPITLSPSFLCDCGFHGFVREGAWVPA